MAARSKRSARPKPPASKPAVQTEDTVMIRVKRRLRDFVATKAEWGESLGDALERLLGFQPNGKPTKGGRK